MQLFFHFINLIKQREKARNIKKIKESVEYKDLKFNIKLDYYYDEDFN